MIIIGNLGGEPELRYTPNGAPVTSFNVATSRTYTTADGERHEETEWLRVSAWNRLAESCNQFLSKGKKVYVEGRFVHREWSGMDGQPRCSHEISASEVRFLSPRDDATSFNPTNQEEFVPEAPPQDEPDVPW